jgi:hypothetical protein
MHQLDLLPSPPKLRDPDRVALWREGLAALISVLGLRPDACRKLLGRLSAASKQDYVGLLALIREAVKVRPDEPVSWLIAGARHIGNPTQDWGLSRWYPAAPQAVRDWPIEVYEDIMAATGMPPSWHGSLVALDGWIKDGYRPDSIAEVIAQAAAQFDGEVRSLAFFNQAVRRNALVWSEARMEYVTP